MKEGGFVAASPQASRLRRRLFSILSWLPAALAIATGFYIHGALLGHFSEGNQAAVWRLMLVFPGLAAGVAIPRFWVRMTCTMLLLGLAFLSGFSIGLFYLPTVFLAAMATIAKLDEDP